MRSRIAALGALLTLALAATPVAAVTKGGVDDAGEHPMVGQLLFYLPDSPSSPYPNSTGGWGSCTGTLLNSTVIVTAGHCTFGVGLEGESTTTAADRFTAANGNGSGGTDIWFTTVADGSQWDGFPASSSFTTEEARYEARAAWADANWLSGTAYPHPEYDDRQFFMHDLGVVVLDASDAVTGIDYAEAVDEVGYLDRYGAKRNAHRFEVVGYGLNEVTGAGKVQLGGDVRMKAEPRLVNLKQQPSGHWMVISNNANTGGTCYGDSGGPTFDNTNSTLVVAVTSFGLSPNCRGIGGAYRLDQPDDQAFLAQFGVATPG